MKRIVRFIQVQAGVSYDPKFASGSGESPTGQHLNGYIQNRSSNALPGMLRSWGYRMVVTSVFSEPEVDTAAPIYRKSNGIPILQLQPVGRLVPLTAPSNTLLDKPLSSPEAKERSERDAVQRHLANVITLRPVQSGKSYRIASPPARGLVRPELAEALETVFERFASEQGFSSEKPLEISLSRGYKADSHGHKEGRAADIDAVGGKSLLQWKQEWDRAMSSARKLDDPKQRAEAIAAEQRRNLGYGLYKALQAHGGWRVNPGGWRVYRNVMQLFGPWTATEGPWKAMKIENPAPEERQRLADQQWVFQAHQDHIHVASRLRGLHKEERRHVRTNRRQAGLATTNFLANAL